MLIRINSRLTGRTFYINAKNERLAKRKVFKTFSHIIPVHDELYAEIINSKE